MMLIEIMLTDKQKVLLHTKKKEIPRVNVTQLLGKHFPQH
jgi:hypothetical protein